jgi:PleD family two-component response regulator
VTVLNAYFPVRDEEGRISRIGGVTTELQNARKALRQTQESLHQSEKPTALGKLVTGVAPELNNPSAVVLGRILIVDDEAEIAAILTDCLARLGIETDSAADGPSALHRLVGLPFNGIFCDIKMLGMDGLAFYTPLKESNPAKPRVLVTIRGEGYMLVPDGK